MTDHSALTETMANQIVELKLENVRLKYADEIATICSTENGKLKAENARLKANIDEAMKESWWWVNLPDHAVDILGARNHVRGLRAILKERND